MPLLWVNEADTEAVRVAVQPLLVHLPELPIDVAGSRICLNNALGTAGIAFQRISRDIWQSEVFWRAPKPVGRKVPRRIYRPRGTPRPLAELLQTIVEHHDELLIPFVVTPVQGVSSFDDSGILSVREAEALGELLGAAPVLAFPVDGVEIVIPAGDRAASVEVVPEIVHLIEGTLDEDEHGWKPTAPREEDTRAYPLAVGPKRTAVSKWNVGIVRALPGARSLRDGACPGRSTRLPTPRARLGARLSWLDLYDLRRLAGYLLFDCQPTEDLYRGFVLHDDLAAASNREKRPPAVLPMSRVDWRRPGKMQTKGWFKAAAASVGITSGKELAVLGALARVDVLRSKSRADPRTVEAVLGFSDVSRAINYWRH